jgi:hypothetical protein
MGPHLHDSEANGSDTTAVWMSALVCSRQLDLGPVPFLNAG